MGLAVVAGLVSTIVFAGSMLPMVVKAVVTRDLESYSLGSLVLVNGGNVFHSLYVFSLPAGPIWILHSFHVTTSALMLVWYLRFAGRRQPPQPEHPRDGVPAAAGEGVTGTTGEGVTGTAGGADGLRDGVTGTARADVVGPVRPTAALSLGA